MFYNIANFCLGSLPFYAEFQYNEQKLKELRNRFNIMQNYLTLYSNRADYEGLPEEFLELSGKNRMWLTMLFFAPAIAFFKHEAMGLQALPVSAFSEYNIAGFPTKWKAIAFNGTSYELDEKDSVLMFNDYAFSIPFIKMLYNTDLMLECDTTHRQNLHAQRQPLIMEIEEDEKKSAQEFVNKLKDSDTIVVRKRMKKEAGKRMGENPFDTKTFESGRAFEGDNLASDYQYFNNRNLTMLGYNNENLEKKERLLVDEVNSNNAVVDSFYTVAIDCQKEAFDKINKMFGYNIKVIPKRMKSIEQEVENVKSDTTLQEGKTAEKLDSRLEKEV